MDSIVLGGTFIKMQYVNLEHILVYSYIMRHLFGFIPRLSGFRIGIKRVED